MANKLTRRIGQSLGLAGALLLQIPVAMAQTGSDATLPSRPTVIPDGFRDLPSIVNTVFKVVITAAGVIFILMFLIGGIQYLSSAGNEESTGKARKLLIDAVIGLVIVLAAWALGNWVLNALGYQVGRSTQF